MLQQMNSKKRVRWHRPGIKLSVDGNSLMSGINADNTLLGVTGVLRNTLMPMAMHGYANVAVSGQNWDSMISGAADIDAAFDATKVNVLYVQEGTNQNGSSTAAQNAQKTWDYVAGRLAAHPWDRVVVGIPPPRYLGDQVSEQTSIDWNIKLDQYIILLKAGYRAHGIHALFDWRQAGSPFSQSRYPDYTKATFFDATVVNGCSNNTAWVTEDAGGATPNQKVHPTVLGNTLLAPFLRDCLLRI